MTTPIYANEAGQIIEAPIDTTRDGVTVVDGTTVTSAVLRVTDAAGVTTTWTATIFSATETDVVLRHVTDGTEDYGQYHWRAWLVVGATEYPTTASGRFTISANTVPRT